MIAKRLIKARGNHMLGIWHGKHNNLRLPSGLAQQSNVIIPTRIGQKPDIPIIM